MVVFLFRDFFVVSLILKFWCKIYVWELLNFNLTTKFRFVYFLTNQETVFSKKVSGNILS